MKIVRWETIRRKWMKDPEFRKAVKALEPKYSLIRAVLDKRIKRKLTQTALAKKMKTKQSVIARVEAGNGNPTFAFLKRLANALDCTLTVSFKDKYPQKVTRP